MFSLISREFNQNLSLNYIVYRKKAVRQYNSDTRNFDYNK